MSGTPQKKSSIRIEDYSEEEIKKAHEVLYNEGLRMRMKVNGEAYVEKALEANKDAFAKPMQEVTSLNHNIYNCE